MRSYQAITFHILSQQTFTASLRQEGAHARTNLKVLETLTYSCTEPEHLRNLANKLDCIISEFRLGLVRSRITFAIGVKPGEEELLVSSVYSYSLQIYTESFC